MNGLDSKSDFTIRVAAVRVPPPNKSVAGGATSPGELVGSYSPPCVFTTLSSSAGDGGSAMGADGGKAADGGRGVRGGPALGSAGSGKLSFLPSVRML